MKNWKIILLRAAGFGAGLGLFLAILISGFAWWFNRPQKPKPWDKAAITAKLRNAHDNDGKIGLTYELTNNTDKDLRIQNASDIHLSLNMDGAIIAQNVDQYASVDMPIFIPSHQTGLLLIKTSLGIPEDAMKQLAQTDDPNDKTDVILKAKKFTNFSGVVLFDQLDRYQIECVGIDKAIKKASVTK